MMLLPSRFQLNDGCPFDDVFIRIDARILGMPLRVFRIDFFCASIVAKMDLAARIEFLLSPIGIVLR